jgi:transposase InsO family protein
MFGFVKVYHQSNLAAPDTVQSKRKFEQEAGLSNASITRYHGDNGIFQSAKFKEETTELGQVISFSGVGAHHQNGKAERAIKTIFFRARSMMLHASLNWPDSTNKNIWPFAVNYAVHLWNHSEGIESGMAPAELFSGVKYNCGLLRHARVWGCPAYVLDPKLQDGKKMEQEAVAASFLVSLIIILATLGQFAT